MGKKGKIVNRCDHRRLVTKDENLDNCRDANEEGSKPYNGGCKASPTIGEPIDEDALIGDSMCWEMSKFGAPEDGDDENDDPAIAKMKRRRTKKMKMMRTMDPVIAKMRRTRTRKAKMMKRKRKKCA